MSYRLRILAEMRHTCLVGDVLPIVVGYAVPLIPLVTRSELCKILAHVLDTRFCQAVAARVRTPIAISTPCP